MTANPQLLAAILVVAALWLAIAAALSVLASLKIRRAQAVVGTAKQLKGLLEAAPARPLLVLPDGSIDTDRILLRDLGIEDSPTRFDQLGGEQQGIVTADLMLLKADLVVAALGAKPMRRMVRLAASNRVVEVRGAPAAPPHPQGSMLLWLFDISDAETERAALARRLGQTESALDALTHLIEAAPFPMWYRGPDLSLGLVNSAFVAAVEARDAAEVIARGSELVDVPGGDSARAGAQRAIETRQALSRARSRRPSARSGECSAWSTCRFRPGAVAGFAIDIQDLEDARIELARHMESQRELADHMTAGAVQFDADRNLDFFNQPFVIMARLDPEWLAEKPEFDRVLERMREMNRLPEVRDFPAWKAERRDWFTIARGIDRGGLDPRQRRPSPRRRTALARRRAAADRRGPHRAGPARLVARHLAPRPRGDLRQSVRGDQRVRVATGGSICGTAASAKCGTSTRRGLASIRGSTSWSRRWRERLVNPTAAAQVRELVRSTTSEPPIGQRPRVDDRRPPFRIRRGAAARRQRAVHDGRRHRFQRASRRRCANAPPRSRKPTGSRPTSSPT